MSIAVSSLVVVFGGLLFALLGSQVELYRNVLQNRMLSGLIDEPRPLELGDSIGRQPSSFGLPAELDSGNYVILFLSDRCNTCKAIASALDGAIPPDVFLVVDAGAGSVGEALNLRYEVSPQRAVVDTARRIGDEIRITTTPAAAIVVEGHILRAESVPSTRALERLLRSVREMPTASAHLPSQENGRWSDERTVRPTGYKPA